MTKARIEIPKEKITEFCQKHRIQRLSLFGSVLSNDFGPDSDVDVLVRRRRTSVPMADLIASEIMHLLVISERI